MIINDCLVYKIIYKLALFSILLFKCIFFYFHSKISDCKAAFQKINEEETLIINNWFVLKYICHNVHAQICVDKKYSMNSSSYPRV